MPGSKRKIDEDTWIVSQSKKFKQGILLSSVYGKTFTHKTAPTSVHFVRSSLVCVKLSHLYGICTCTSTKMTFYAYLNA